MLSPRATRIAVSPTMKVAADAMKLKAEGVDVVDLGAGEPDFPTPDHVSAAAHAAIDAHFTKYTTNSGTDELKRAIVARYREDCGIEFTTAETIVTAGGKQALFNSVMVLFGSGDEVITHMPGWPTLVEQIKLADATPVIVRTHAEDGFRLRADTILGAVTARTRGIIINSPSNPTGALISEADLEQVAQRGCPPRDLGPARSLLRETDLRPDASQPARCPGPDDEGSHRAVRIGVEGLCDDRLALWLGAGTGSRRERVQRDSEPLDVERFVDHPEGSGRGAERAAVVRDRHAERIPPPARSADHVARRGTAAAARQTGRSVLPVSGRVGLSLARRGAHVIRPRGRLAQGHARGDHAW